MFSSSVFQARIRIIGRSPRETTSAGTHQCSGEHVSGAFLRPYSRRLPYREKKRFLSISTFDFHDGDRMDMADDSRKLSFDEANPLPRRMKKRGSEGTCGRKDAMLSERRLKQIKTF
ncbi:hypothetical protein B2D07_00265 [Desulfococcus multivorans]|nr:hypothetical protein B2D07_00265 [Desulfococcus multivorans]